MSEEIQAQKQQKNTVALVGMICSIAGFVLLFTVIGTTFGFFLLFLGLILGIIGLFYKPRGKARVAICIPLIVFVVLTSFLCYIWSSIKTPAKEWYDWVKPNMEQLLNEEDFDNDRFNEILQGEFNNISSHLSEEEFKAEVEASSGSNAIEKWAYFGFGLFQQAIENAIEKYNDGYIPEDNEDTTIDTNDNDINKDNIDEDDTENNVDEILDSNGDNMDKIDEDEENNTEGVEQSNIEIFSESEKNDIEQIINILE